MPNIASRREEIAEFVANISSAEVRQRLYVRANLSPFEEIVLFGYDNCYVSHQRLASESSQRAAFLCRCFSALSTTRLEGEAYEHEVEYELEETDARGNSVTNTRLDTGTIEWPVVRTEEVDEHSDGQIRLREWFQHGPTDNRVSVSWSQINRTRDVVAAFSEGAVIHGTLPEHGDEHALIQVEPLIISGPAYQKAVWNNWGVSDEELVDALVLTQEELERHNQRGATVANFSGTRLDFIDMFQMQG